MSKKRLCFVVNPLAGIGGRLGFKGSNGVLGVEALRRGAELVAPRRAERFLRRLGDALGRVVFFTAGGVMGAEELRSTGAVFREVYTPRHWPTTLADTVRTVQECTRHSVELVVFVGGDGTARDVRRALVESSYADLPILGVPSGVKVYSSVFARSPEAAAEIVKAWLRGEASRCVGEILDVDEEAYRRGRLSVRLYDEAITLCHPLMVGSSKQPSPATVDEEENRLAVARHFVEHYYSPCTLYVLGPGSTVAAIARVLGVEKTLLGVDVVHNGRLVGRDVDENTLHKLVKEHTARGGRVVVVLTPIGGQGFLLGRGNQQISPQVIREVGGLKSIVVVATHSKMSRLRVLYVDTGDPDTDRLLEGYTRVIVDYGEEIIVPVRAASKTS